MRLLIFLSFVSIIGKASPYDTLLLRIRLIKSDTEQANQLYRQGFAIRNNDPQSSFYYAKLAEKAALASHSEKHLAKSYNLLGILYYKKGNYRTALDYHHKALQMRQQCKDLTGIAHSQLNLGNVYADLHLYEKAESAYLVALQTYKQLDNREKMADCLLNIGTIKHQLKQYDQAIGNYRMAEQLTGLNDYNTKAIFFTNMAEASLCKGQIEKSIALNEDALKLRMIADNTLEVGDNYLNLGGAYLALNDLLKAKYYLDTAWCIADRYNYSELRYETCKRYAVYYSQAKNFEQAFYWQQKYAALEDSLQAEQLEARLRFDFNDLEKTRSVSEAVSFHNAWLLVAMIVLLISIPFTLIRFKR